MSQAVLIAIGIDWAGGRRQIPGGRNGQPRKPFIVEGLPHWLEQTRPQRRRVRRLPTIMPAFARPSARSCPTPPSSAAASTSCATPSIHLPRKADDDCLQELRWLYDRRSVEEARHDLAAWIAKWGVRYPSSSHGSEETIEQTLTFYRLRASIISISKSTNMLQNTSTRRSGDEPMS